MRVALQPAALNDHEVAQHYRDTIDNRVPFTQHVDVVPVPVMATLGEHFPQHTAQFWGATPGRNETNVSKWEKLAEGDAVFFYGQKRLYLAGHVALTFRNEPLANRLWGRNQHDLTWELMFALTNLREVSVPIAEVREAVGWSDKAFVQGFTVFEGEKADRLSELVNLDSLPTLSGRRSDTADQVASPSTSTPDGPTDESRTGRRRREHAAFKSRLIELAGGTCALCGNQLPAPFLVGAHIKKRSSCTEDERKDFDNVGMLACLLGCDSLFEHGLIAVDQGGAILISNAVAEHATPALTSFIEERLAGRSSAWWTYAREPYFAWHRQHVFLKLHNGS